jgi:glycosyltransferase involved in cell wall biosynthesis
MTPSRTKILFIHSALTEFVRLDLEELRKSFDVTERAELSRFINPLALWREISKHDVVFGWFASWHTFLPMQFARLQGKPSVLVVGGYDVANMPEIRYGHQRGGLKKWVSRCTMRLATRLITNSDYSREEIARNIGLTNASVAAIYHGVPDRFGALPLPKERMALTVGNVDRSNLLRKGHEPFVRAAALLPDVKFVVAGAWQDDAIDHLRNIATPNVEFTGRVTDDTLLNYYLRASVYVQPSLHEGFGMSVAEAMLAGCVPVTSVAGALPEVTGDAGVRLNSTDPHDVARGIEAALSFSDADRQTIRARVLDQFPMSNRGTALAETVRSLNEARQTKPLPEIPFVSVVMPIRNEGAFIERSLGAVLAQDYPTDRLEVIVADGMSTDRTRELATELIRDRRRVRLIENPGKIVATGLNAALRVAQGEVIVRVDGHTVINSDYVRECVAALQTTAGDNVGGRMNSVSEGWFGGAVAAATSSRFGVGGARFHYSDQEQWVDTVYLGAWRRDVFQRIGTFDEEMVRNQDDEFNYRLRAARGKILLSPRIQSQYYNRATPLALWKQYFQYGYWKVRVMQKHPRQMQLRQFIPAMFVLWLLSLAVLSAIVKGAWIVLFASLALYVAAAVIASVLAATRAGWRLLPLLPFSFLTIHFSYGFGFLIGLIVFWNRWEITDRAKTVQTARDAAST